MPEKLPIRQELVDAAAKALLTLEVVYGSDHLLAPFASVRRLVEACQSQRTVDERIAELLKTNTALVLENRELKAIAQVEMYRCGIISRGAKVPSIFAGRDSLIPAIIPGGEYVVPVNHPLAKEPDNG